jgi:hypothetical protein
VEDPNTELMPLGSLQKGSIDIVGATVTIIQNGHDFIIRIENKDKPPFEVGHLCYRFLRPVDPPNVKLSKNPNGRL